MILRLLVLGALALLGQVVLLRECGVAFYGSELVLVLGLGAWLLGTAAGALSARRTPARAGTGSGSFLAVGALLPLAVVLARGARVLFGGVPGADLPFGTQLAALALCLVPASFLLGMLFPRLAARYCAAGAGGPAAAYALESAGGIAGGVLATALPAAGVPNWPIALLCGLAACAVAAPSDAARPTRDPWANRAPALAGCGLLLVLLAWAGPLDRAMARWNHPDLLATRDTPYGRVTVTGALGQVVVFENGALAHESQGTAAEEFVHLAAVQRDTVRRVLVLGGGAQGLIGEVLRHRPERVDDVELDRGAFALVAAWLPPEQRRALADPRVRVTFGDPRRFLARAGRYDLVLSGMPEPESGRTNRFYTREFFAACAEHLAPAGVLALRLRSAENLWTPALTRRTAGVARALRAAFPATVVLPGTTNLLLASGAPLPADPGLLGTRLAARVPDARRATPAYARYLYTNDRFAEIASRLARDPAGANRDARPACYQATMVLWLSRFFPRLARLDLPDLTGRQVLRAPATWVAGALLVLAFALTRRRDVWRRALFAAAAGCTGMLLEAVLLLDYQTRSGVLYQDLGLLLTAFMAGLALGAWAFERAVGARDARPRAPRADHGPGARARRAGPGPGAGAFVAGALAVLGVACALAVRGGPGGGLVTTATLLAATGALVAAAYAYAVLRGAPDASAVVGPAYAADLLGGCLGSLAAGLVTIPMLGLPATAALAAAVALAALVLV